MIDVELICRHRCRGKTQALQREVLEQLAVWPRTQAVVVLPFYDRLRHGWEFTRARELQGRVHVLGGDAPHAAARMRGLDGTGGVVYVDDAHLLADGLEPWVREAATARFERVVATYTPSVLHTLDLLDRLDAAAAAERRRRRAAARAAAEEAETRVMVGHMLSSIRRGRAPELSD